MEEKKQKNVYRNTILNKSKNFPTVKNTLDFLQGKEVCLYFDNQQKTYLLICDGKTLHEFKNGVVYNEMKKNDLKFSTLWAFSNLEYNSLKEAYKNLITIDFMSPYKISKYIENNSPQ